MIPSLDSVFVIREVNVTTLVNQYKVPSKFAEYVNGKDRKNADILMNIFTRKSIDNLIRSYTRRHPDDSLEKSSDDQNEDAHSLSVWRTLFDDFWEEGLYLGPRAVSRPGREISEFLKRKPAMRGQFLSILSSDPEEGLSSCLEKLMDLMDVGAEDRLSHRADISFSDGFYWVQLLSSKECGREGTLMQHCGQKNKPHVTIELADKNYVNKGNILQCRGKQNSDPDRKYWKYIEEFCKKKDVTFVDWNRTDDLELAKAVDKIKSIPGSKRAPAGWGHV
jgi:hypothetical protein